MTDKSGAVVGIKEATRIKLSDVEEQLEEHWRGGLSKTFPPESKYHEINLEVKPQQCRRTHMECYLRQCSVNKYRNKHKSL